MIIKTQQTKRNKEMKILINWEKKQNKRNNWHRERRRKKEIKIFDKKKIIDQKEREKERDK